MDTAIRNSGFECHCCDYCRLRQISYDRRKRWSGAKIRITFLGLFVTSLVLFAICVYRCRCVSEELESSGVDTLSDVIKSRRLLSRRESNDENVQRPETSSRNEKTSDDLRPQKQERRKTQGEKIPRQKTNTGARRPHKISSRPRKMRMPLGVFKARVNKAKSYDAILDLIRAGGLTVDRCRSTSRGATSKGRRPSKRRPPTALLIATTTTMMTTTMMMTTTTCPRRNVTVYGSFDQSNRGDSVAIPFCGPVNSTTDDPQTDAMIEKYSNWMERVTKDTGLCRPMDMVVDLENSKDTGHDDSRPTIVVVRKCSPLYSVVTGVNEYATPTCRAVKRTRRTVSFRSKGEWIRSYVIYDDVKCRASNSMSKSGKTQKDDGKFQSSGRNGKRIKRCPWPFKLMASECSCRPKTVGAAGFLVYKSCQRIRSGFWRLQDKQAECVRTGRCRQPNCNSSKVYDAERGQCLPSIHHQQQQQQQQPNASASNSQRVYVGDNVNQTLQESTSVGTDNETTPST